MNYPITNPDTVKDNQTGRVVYIDDPTSLTPKEFMSYVDEGFVPIARTVSSGTTSFDFVSFGESNGVYTITVGQTSYVAEGAEASYVASA